MRGAGGLVFTVILIVLAVLIGLWIGKRFGLTTS